MARAALERRTRVGASAVLKGVSGTIVTLSPPDSASESRVVVVVPLASVVSALSCEHSTDDAGSVTGGSSEPESTWTAAVSSA